MRRLLQSQATWSRDFASLFQGLQVSGPKAIDFPRGNKCYVTVMMMATRLNSGRAKT
jgi:hypothetical protein